MFSTKRLCRAALSTGLERERSYRPLRSVMYVPASNARALEKARNVRTDALILDLEDAVAPLEKDAARSALVNILSSDGEDFPFGLRTVAVRVNALDTPWGEDDVSQLSACPGVDALVLPKTEGKDHVSNLERLMLANGGFQKDIWCMVETPIGVLRAEEIASALPNSRRVRCLV